jgi:hypothetical protein
LSLSLVQQAENACLIVFLEATCRSTFGTFAFREFLLS